MVYQVASKMLIKDMMSKDKLILVVIPDNTQVEYLKREKIPYVITDLNDIDKLGPGTVISLDDDHDKNSAVFEAMCGIGQDLKLKLM